MNIVIKSICTALFILAMAAPVKAEEQISHSLYKVTTYNLGTSVDFQDFAPVSSEKYKPLLITSTKADILGSDQNKDLNLETSANKTATRGFAVAAEYSPLSRLALQGVLGVTKNSWDPSSTDHASSWEANLGVIYKMFNNLSYELHFGYMDTGDLFKERNTYTDVESIIMISNKLTMSF